MQQLLEALNKAELAGALVMSQRRASVIASRQQAGEGQDEKWLRSQSGRLAQPHARVDKVGRQKAKSNTE
jgi:hypothetical protein